MKTIRVVLIFFLSSSLVTFSTFGQGHFKSGSGTRVTVRDGAAMVLSDLHLVNDGVITQISDADIIKFSGAVNVNFGGIGTNALKSIRISKTNGATVSLLQSLSVSNVLSFENGFFNLVNSIVTLAGDAGISGESESARIVATGSGYVEVQANLNGPVSANPGNLGAVISSAENLGLVTVRRGHQSQSNSFGNGSSILRYYDISATNNTNLDATFRLHYLDAELNGINEPSLTMWKSTDNQSWSHMGWTNRDGVTNFVERTGVTSFSRWTLSSLGNTLPLTLLTFDGKLTGGIVELQWITRNESGVSSFVVEKSVDGINYHEMTAVPAVNTAGDHQYRATDFHPGTTAKLFYRIRMVDLDHSYTYSKVILLSHSLSFRMQVYPNPTGGDLTLLIQSDKTSTVSLTVRNLNGQEIFSRFIQLEKGSISETVSASALPPGIYFMELQDIDGREVLRFIRQ